MELAVVSPARTAFCAANGQSVQRILRFSLEQSKPMSSLKLFGALCLVALLRGEVAAHQPETPEPIQCAEDPQTGAWLVTSYVRLPENDNEEVLAARSLMRMSRGVDNKYTGSGAVVLLIPIFNTEPGWRFTYEFLGFYDNRTRVMSASLVTCDPFDIRDSMLWTYDCEKLGGSGANVVNGTLSPFPFRQEVTFLG